MMARFDAGESIKSLMIRYRLGENRVRAVLADERNRRATSPDPFYRNMRIGQAYSDSQVEQSSSNNLSNTKDNFSL
jgi:hypothetical protein